VNGNFSLGSVAPPQLVLPGRQPHRYKFAGTPPGGWQRFFCRQL
jgi:hypothetical protein